MKIKEWKENEDYAVGDKIELPDGEIVEVVINSNGVCKDCFVKKYNCCYKVKCTKFQRRDINNIMFINTDEQKDLRINKNGQETNSSLSATLYRRKIPLDT